MILYHGTTENRAKIIFSQKLIESDCERFYTYEENGDGFTTQGFVYLTNDITYAVYFGNCHCLVDKSEKIVVFRMEIPDELIQPDYDEMRYQDPTGIDRERYANDLECSLLEFKTCRVPFSIPFGQFNLQYLILNKQFVSDHLDIIANAGCDLDYVRNHYTPTQRKFISSAEKHWKECV